MTNYSNYPRHRLVPNSCIICFSPNAYSWCSLTGSTKKYLLTNYIDGAQRIDLKDKDGTGYSNWLRDSARNFPIMNKTR